MVIVNLSPFPHSLSISSSFSYSLAMFSQPGRQPATICATLGIHFHGCAENYTEKSTHCALKARSSLIFVPVGFGSMWSKKLKRPNWLVILNSKCDIKFSLWLHPLVLKVFFFRFVILLSRCLLSMKFYISRVFFCVENFFFVEFVDWPLV